jgi:hypothetical protein
VANLVLPCREGMLAVDVTGSDPTPPGALHFTPQAVAEDIDGCLAAISTEVAMRGGVLLGPPGERENSHA